MSVIVVFLRPLGLRLADFDDIYRICCDFDKAGRSEDMLKLGIDSLSRDSVTDPLLTHSNHWWELAEKEILQENRENVLT